MGEVGVVFYQNGLLPIWMINRRSIDRLVPHPIAYITDVKLSVFHNLGCLDVHYLLVLFKRARSVEGGSDYTMKEHWLRIYTTLRLRDYPLSFSFTSKGVLF